METQVSKTIYPTLNEVEGFNPMDYASIIQSEDGSLSRYLEVKDRILWFRLHRPDGKIVPEIISITENSAVVRCRVYASKADSEDQFIGQAFAQRFRSADEKYGDRFLETAETAATGRALAAAGYGTQFCGPADMLSGVISDAPIELPEEDAGSGAGVANHVVHQLRPEEEQPAAPATPAPVPPAAPKPAPKPATQPTTLEGMMASMTLEEAKNVVVDFGRYAGSTLGQIAMTAPADLDWYVKNYAGKNIALKAGATILMDAARKRAS